MKRPAAAAAAFALTVIIAAGAAPAQPILFTFTGLRGGATDTCKWFDDDINDRSIGALTRQTDLLYNRIALPAGVEVTVRGTSLTEQGEQLVDFSLGSATICTSAQAIYGPTPSPAPTSS